MSVKNWRGPLKEKLQFVSPDGEIYELHNPPNRAVLLNQGWGMSPFRVASGRAPFADFESVYNFRATPRTITVVVGEVARGRNAYWTIREKLVDILRPNRSDSDDVEFGSLRFYRSDGEIRAADVLISSGQPAFTLQQGQWQRYSYVEALEFIAYNPILYNPNQVAVSSTAFTCSTGTELLFPITFPIVFSADVCLAQDSLVVNYPGTFKEFPIIVVTGPADNFQMTHAGTGKLLSLEYNIAAGEVVTFDLRPGIKTVTNNLGANLSSYLSDDSTLSTFAIEANPIVAGGVNTLNVTIENGDANTAVEVDYYIRYKGT